MISQFSGPHAFLSNFFVSPFLFDGILYPSSEHAYQAGKATNENDFDYVMKPLPGDKEDIRYEGFCWSTPRWAKRRGRKVAKKPDFEEKKVEFMYQILLAKFSRPDLRQSLFSTGDHELVEGNNWGDTFWGVCEGEGQNTLGQVLMKVREHYRAIERSCTA